MEALAGLVAAGEMATPFTLSHIASDPEHWVELLAAGLTYDCRGLAPGAPASWPGAGALLGLHEPPPGETITLQPSPHLAEGRGLLPVVRVIAGLGAQLADLPGLVAVHWNPARCWMAPKYFCGVVADWLSGGAFPALGLTSLQRGSDGTMVTAGLDYLIGQELRFEPDRKLVPAAVARIAVRLIHDLVETGPLRREGEFTGPEGEVLRVEPVRQGRQLKVSLLK